MKQYISKLIEHESLTLDEAYAVMRAMGENQGNPAQIAAFITAYLMRPATIAEFRGFKSALMDLAVRVDLSDFNPIDLCGTGGDGKDTFNISTLSAFVVAGAGIPVAKHGNSGVSSKVGSSNVLEFLGIPMPKSPEVLKKHMDEVGICFLHAPFFHPALKHVGPVRRELGIKTIFNQLGPLVNPVDPAVQCSGVFSPELQRVYAYFFQEEGKRFYALHALDGYDEVSLTGAVKVLGNLEESVLQPSDFNLPQVSAASIAGGETPDLGGQIFVDILEGNGSEEQENVVCANAALAIRCYMNEVSLTDAVLLAKESLQSGRALEKFVQLRSLA